LQFLTRIEGYTPQVLVQDLYTIVRPAAGSPGSGAPLLVLLPGLGSDEADLMAFSPMLDERFTVACIRAPFALGWGGFAWFNVEFGPKGPVVDEGQVSESRKILTANLENLIEQLAADQERVILGGFSQGAMMSLGVAMSHPGLVSRLLLMSGMVLPQFELDPTDGLRRLPVLVTHGTSDPILPISQARHMRDFLTAAGAEVEFHEYSMGHEVNPDCLGYLQKWLASGM